MVVERSLRPAPRRRCRSSTADGLAELQALTARRLRRPARSSTTPSRSRRRRAIPRRVGLPQRQAVHRVRRQPARLDQPRPRGPGARGRPRPPLRPPVRRHGARARRAAPPDRAELHGARRGGHGRHDPRPAPAAVPVPQLTSPRSGARRHDRSTPLTRPRTPASPGPARRPRRCCARSTSRSARRIRGLVPGEFRAHDLGGGTELAQVRPYEPGDDVRRIDWNVTARTTIPHVRVHVPERALTAWLLLDVSPSMTFGTADRRKADVAEGVALAVGHLATQRGNRLGVVTFGGPAERRLPPAGGPRGLLATAAVVTRATDSASRPARRRTGRRHLAGARAAVRGRGRARAAGSSCVVSDFRGPRDWLRRLARGRGTPPRPRRRDPRPARGRPARRRRADARRRRDRPRGPRRHVVARSLRERFAAAAAAERAAARRRLPPASASATSSCPPPASWLRSLAGQLRLLGDRVMTFASPELLLGLLLVPLALVGLPAGPAPPHALRRPVHERRPAREPRARGRRRWRRHVPPVLYLLAIAALVVALARPSMRSRSRARRRRSSWRWTSRARCGRPTSSRRRLAAAQQAASRLRRPAAGGVPGRAGRVLDRSRGRASRRPRTGPRSMTALDDLAGRAAARRWATRSRLSLETRAASRRRARRSGRSLRAPRPRRPPTRRRPVRAGRTADASRRSSRPSCSRTGRTRPAGSSRSDAAAQAAALGVPVYTIALGTAGRHRGGPGRVRPSCSRVERPARHRDARRVAELTGARFFEAPTADDLSGSTRASAPGSATPRRSRRSPSGSPPPGSLLVVGGAGAGRPLVQPLPLNRERTTRPGRGSDFLIR